ncbi:MAG: prolipoprotein diacylglyceryl transferase [Clostridia bacterium]|nr:prolipoprotein diacylglyceryl transferase [Clostridia bacterium]
MFPYLHVFGIDIPMYGLLMATALLVSVGLSFLRCRRRGLDGEKLLTIALIAVVFGIVGAKVLFMVVTYSWDEITAAVKANGFIWIFQGGLVFYGGLIGGVIGAFVGAALAKAKIVLYSDPIVPTLPLAHAIGRMGCFCAGCCYGKVTESWIGMRFPSAVTGLAENVKVIPTQLIEAGANLIVFLFLLWFTRKKRQGFTTLFVYLFIYGVERFLLEYLRGDEIRGIFGAFSTSQWISIGLVVIAAAGLIVTKVVSNKRSNEAEKGNTVS